MNVNDVIARDMLSACSDKTLISIFVSRKGDVPDEWVVGYVVDVSLGVVKFRVKDANDLLRLPIGRVRNYEEGAVT